MMNQIDPLEIHWHGHRFRSRLEARWKIFMDSMGIDSMYEAEAFQLPDGTRYFPDFYLPVVFSFAEVKSLLEDPREALSKLSKLSEFTNHQSLLLEGPPAFRLYRGICPKFSLEEPLWFSLDIYNGRTKWYWQEHRLYCGSGEYDGGCFNELSCSDQYADSVYKAISERFGT